MKNNTLRTLLATVFVVLIGSWTPPLAGQAAQFTAIDTELLEGGVDARRLDAGLIVAWNELAHDTAVADDQFLSFKGQRALAMMHLAMHDALNSIRPVYERYAYAGPRAIAHPIAAAAQASPRRVRVGA